MRRVWKPGYQSHAFDPPPRVRSAARPGPRPDASPQVALIGIGAIAACASWYLFSGAVKFFAVWFSLSVAIAGLFGVLVSRDSCKN